MDTPERPPLPQGQAAAQVRCSADRRERLLFPLLWLWCAFVWSLLARAIDPAVGHPLGLGLTVAVVLFYALLWMYLGPPRTRGAWVLLGYGLLLALTFALTSENLWFRVWNALLLLALVPIQLYQWRRREDAFVWSDPRMLLQRPLSALLGLFQALGVNLAVFTGCRDRRSKRLVWVAAGLGVSLLLLLVLVPLLLSADALFSQLAGHWLSRLAECAGQWLIWLVLGAFLLPFLMSLLYTLRRPQDFPLPKLEFKTWALEPALGATVLAVLDGLYLLFLAVQSAALFGGADYLAQAGISYATYARSGFFQLVFVVFLNLTVLLLTVGLSRREGRLWRGVQVLGTLLLVQSAVLLISAAWRMSLYVGSYGLSLRRILTYWGMLVAAFVLVLALLKLWRPSFAFFRAFAVGVLALWLALNAADPAYLAARYNVDAYQRGALTQIDGSYLAGLSYDALGPLSTLPGDTPIHGGTLAERIPQFREKARDACRDWRSWNLSAWLNSGN